MGTDKFNAGGNPVMSQYLIQGRVEVLLVASCNRNLNKLQPDGPVVAYADLAYLYLQVLNCILQ